MINYLQSQPGDDPIIVEGFFAASPARVFRAWTDPDLIVKWFGYKPNSLHSAHIDLREGGAWQFVTSRDDNKTTGFEGHYQEVRLDEKIAFSWAQIIAHVDGEREASATSHIEIEFTPKGSGTQVKLVHSGVRTEDARKGIGGGWVGSFGSMVDLFANEAGN